MRNAGSALAAFTCVACAAGEPSATLGPPHGYLGLTTPGDAPEVFAPGIVSTDVRELNAIFSKDGRELYFTRDIAGVLRMFWMRFGDGAWGEAEQLDVLPGQPAAYAADMMLSPDGERLYFLSNAISGRFRDGSDNIWVSSRGRDGWEPAEVLPEPVNTDASEVYPSVASDGSMYFASNRPGGYGGYDIYRAQYRDGIFVDAQNLGPTINTDRNEGDPFVAPDESYIIVAAEREDNLGQFDLHISYRTDDGSWPPLVSLGSELNSTGWDYCPYVTPDGKYLFFSRRTRDGGNVYWVDASVLDRFRQTNRQRR
jgi:Tol biopolymer transport system component